MPQIKIDHVVSFSSEDPIHVANNLLSQDTTRKWKCRTPGEKMASVVLQLEKACVITGIDIGNEHSAYVEILVSRSGTTDDFKVLLVMSSFMTALESRQSQNVNKVRMFKQEDLSKPECEEKWDRVKIVCTQPCNRHVQYGLCFINFFTSDNNLPNHPVQPTIGKFTLRPESPDDLSAGSLFARRKEVEQEPLKAAAAIRVASSSSASPKPKINKLPLTPRPKKDSDDSGSSSPKPRNRNEILYAKDEEESSEKIEKIIEKKAREKQERKQKEEKETVKTSKEKNKKDSESKKHRPTKQSLDTSITSSKIKNDETKRTALDILVTASPGTSKTKKETSKRKHSEESFSRIKRAKDQNTKPFANLLEGVVLVISGIQNPDRANLRTSALAMGAKYKPDWDKDCTHLICAFANTPKFNQVRGKGKIVTRKWIEDCYSKRKRLPWRRYALDKKDLGDESEEEICEEVIKDITPLRSLKEDSDIDGEKDDEGSDTEERIAQILAKQALKPADNKNNDIYEADTDTEPESNDKETTSKPPNANGFKDKLDNFFVDKIFFLDETFEEEIYNELKRYIIAYGGILSDDPTKDVDIFVTKKNNILKEINPEARCVLPDWVWECHNCQKLVPMDDFVL